MRTLNNVLGLVAVAACLLAGDPTPSTGAPTSAAQSTETGLMAPAITPVVLQGRRVKLARPCAGSWCPDGFVALQKEGNKFENPALGFYARRDGNTVTTLGRTKSDWATRKVVEYVPTDFSGEAYSDKWAKIEKAETEIFCQYGQLIEVASQDRVSTVVYYARLEGSAIIMGVVSGWEFQLEAEKLYVVDANSDGLMSTEDCMVYGARSVWMPWHSITSSGNTVYRDITPDPKGVLKANTFKMADRGQDAPFWEQWQTFRKDHGLPPGVFSPKVAKALRAHADYCKANKYQGLAQVEGKVGYTKEGQQAAKASAIHFLEEELRMYGFETLTRSIYQRQALLDPQTIALAVGNNEYASLWGSGVDAELPTEERPITAAQVFPGPGSAVREGMYGYDLLSCPIGGKPERLGLPITVRFHGEPPTAKSFAFTLHLVEQEKGKPEKTTPIKATLVLPSEDKSLAGLGIKGMFTLIPAAPLKAGIYRATFSSPDDAKLLRTWSFEVYQ